MKKKTAVCCFVVMLVAVMTFTASASTWLGIQDSEGYTWARVLLVNESDSDSNWSISGCRTAVASDADTAEVDSAFDWNGRVAAGSSQYVWVYGKEISEIFIANADGDASAYLGSVVLDESGDGELVIVVGADGASSVSVEASDGYSVPMVAGGLPQ